MVSRVIGISAPRDSGSPTQKFLLTEAQPKIFYSKLLNRILRYCKQIILCSNGGAAYMNSKLIAKANLNIANVMQIFGNLILQSCSSEFYDIATRGPWVCVIKVWSNGGAT